MYKNIRTELSLPITQRANANDLLQNIRDKIARITEIAPQIPNSIIKRFKRKFKSAQISKPIVANGLDPIEICVLDKPRNNGSSHLHSIIGQEKTDDLSLKIVDSMTDLSSNVVIEKKSAIYIKVS